MTDRTADLVLLAEKGMRWECVDSYLNAHAHNQFWVREGRILLFTEHRGIFEWSPNSYVDDAAMLMCALGINLRQVRDAPQVSWEAWVGCHAPSAYAEGNDPAAICQAVVDCALKIVRAREGKQ